MIAKPHQAQDASRESRIRTKHQLISPSTKLTGELVERKIAELKASSAYNLTYPKLPPTLAYRNGLSRRSLSQGIAYALPVDQPTLNFRNQYRVDLRAMFQDPYRATAHTFDEERLLAVSSLSHRPKTSKSGNRETLKSVIRQGLPSYATDKSILKMASSNFSAEGVASVSRLCSAGPRNRDLFSPSKNQLRSKLNQDVEDPGHNEIQNLAQSILREMDIEIKDDFYDKVNSGTPNIDDNESGQKAERPQSVSTSRERGSRCITPAEQREQLKVSVVVMEDPNTPPEDPCGEIPKKNVDLRLQIANLSDFAEFKKLGPKFRPSIPESARSPYVNDATNTKIWNWLTQDEVVNSFDYFMFLCGKQ